MNKASLMYPMFVMDGENKVEEIPSMEGQYRYTVDRMGECLQELLDAGVTSVMLFGIPAVKDEVGSQAYDDNGIVQRALRYAKEHFPQMYLVTDVCMCEYTFSMLSKQLSYFSKSQPDKLNILMSFPAL